MTELARTSAEVTDRLRHVEAYTTEGLLTLMWHHPAERRGAALVCCGGAMGGLLGPGRGLYQDLGDRWSARGVDVVRVGYRRPNDLDRCVEDLVSAMELLRDVEVDCVVTMGHSFGGAVAIRAAAAQADLAAGVVTFATQSAGCEPAEDLAVPLLLFHGTHDSILPMMASEMVRMIAGRGELVPLVGDDHLLAASHDEVLVKLDDWLPEVLTAL